MPLVHYSSFWKAIKVILKKDDKYLKQYHNEERGACGTIPPTSEKKSWKKMQLFTEII